MVVEVEAFPINPADLLTLTGGYAVRPKLPATLGAEAVGRIRALGDGVGGLAVGDRVILLADGQVAGEILDPGVDAVLAAVRDLGRV